MDFEERELTKSIFPAITICCFKIKNIIKTFRDFCINNSYHLIMKMSTVVAVVVAVVGRMYKINTCKNGQKS